MKAILLFLILSGAAFAQPNKKLPPPFDKATSKYTQKAMRDSLRLFPDTTAHSADFFRGDLTWQVATSPSIVPLSVGVFQAFEVSEHWIPINGDGVNFVNADATDTNNNAMAGAWISKVSGTLKNMTIQVERAPGAGNGDTVIVYKNGSATLMKAIIAEDLRVAYDSTHTVSVAPNDLLSYRYVSSGGSSRVGAFAIELDANGVLNNANFSGTSSGTNTGDQFTNTTAGRLIGRQNTTNGLAGEIKLGGAMSMSHDTVFSGVPSGGTANQFLQTDGAGTNTWASQSQYLLGSTTAAAAGKFYAISEPTGTGAIPDPTDTNNATACVVLPAGHLRNLHLTVSNAPQGGAETDSIVVIQNKAITTLGIKLIHGQYSAINTSSLTIADGDRVAIKVISSAETAAFSWYVEFTRP